MSQASSGCVRTQFTADLLIQNSPLRAQNDRQSAQAPHEVPNARPESARAWDANLDSTTQVPSSDTTLKLAFVAQAQDAQGAGDRAFARRNDGANEQDLGAVPRLGAKGTAEGVQDGYNRAWQVQQRSSFLGSLV